VLEKKMRPIGSTIDVGNFKDMIIQNKLSICDCQSKSKWENIP